MQEHFDLKKIYRLDPPSFALLVKQIKNLLPKVESGEIEAFEVNLDTMRVKGDLAVIYRYFNIPLIVISENPDLLRRGVKAGWPYVRIPQNMELTAEMKNLIKNKKTTILGEN